MVAVRPILVGPLVAAAGASFARMTPPDLDTVAAVLRACWSRETSDDPDEWTVDWPSRGQCGVTAFVLREIYGGEILVAPVHGSHLPGEHHAWNRLPSGEEVDLTADQFRAGETLGDPWVGQVFVTTDGVDRGALLLAAVHAALGADAASG